MDGDDTATFANEIDSGVSRVVVPAGVWSVDGLVMNRPDQKLVLSPGAVLRATPAGSQNVVTFAAPRTGIVAMDAGGVIDGNGCGIAAGATTYIANAAEVTIEGVRFVNCPGIGIAGQGTHPVIRKNTFVDCGSHSISVQPASASGEDVCAAVIDRNTISATAGAGYGIVVHGKSPSRSVRTHITNNDVSLPASESAGLCIETWGLAPRSTIGNNTTTGGQMGISISSSDGAAVGVNTIFGAALIGLEVAASKGVAVSGNTVDGNAATITGICLDNAPGDGNAVTGNTVRNYLTSGLGKGILASGTQTGLTIVGNPVSGLQPIYLKGVRGATVMGNPLDGASVGWDGIALEDCTDIAAGYNVGNGFKRSVVYAFTGPMTGLVIGPNVKTGGTPTEFAMAGKLGAGSRTI